MLGSAELPSWTRGKTTQRSHRQDSAGSLCSPSSQDPIPTQPCSFCSTSHGNSPSRHVGIILPQVSKRKELYTLTGWHCLPSIPLEQLSSQAPPARQPASARSSLGLDCCIWKMGRVGVEDHGVRMVNYQLFPPS